MFPGWGRSRPTAFVTALVLAGQAFAAGPSMAADPAGTVDVNRIPARTPVIEVLGASQAGLLYHVHEAGSDPSTGPTMLKPTGQPAYEVSSSFKYLKGDKIFDGARKYLMIGSTTERTCTSVPAPARPRGQDGASYTPFGWLAEEGQWITADANGCRVTGQGPAIGAYELAAADESGYVTASTEGGGFVYPTYHSYAAPDQPKAIDTGGHSAYAYGFALDGSVVTWAERETLDGSSYVVRSSTTGGPATVTNVGLEVDKTAIIGSATGWAACKRSVSCAAGSISTAGVVTRAAGSRSLASDGSRFLVDTYGSSPGVDAATVVDGNHWTRVETVVLPPVSYGVGLGAGVVGYIDSQGLSRRPFTKSGSTISLGGPTKITYSGEYRVSRDGRRTAYLDQNDDLWLITDDGVKTRVFDAVGLVSVVQTESEAPFQLSGHRLLWIKSVYPSSGCSPIACDPAYERAMLYDLRTGVNTDVGEYVYGKQFALWGNYLAYSETSGRILRKDLSSGAVVEVKAAGPTVAGLDVNGTIVAWSTCVVVDRDPCHVSKVGYRVVSGTFEPAELTSEHSNQVSLTGGYLAFTTTAEFRDAPVFLKTVKLGVAGLSTVGQMRPGSETTVKFDAFDETVGWIGTDGVTRLTPLAAFTARPRYLGNATGAASFPLNSSWTLELPISKALPTCTVTIKSGTTVKRTIPCTTSVGAARAIWNSRDAAGNLVAKGKYSWTLTGSDADGGLLWWNGSANPISGTVTVA